MVVERASPQWRAAYADAGIPLREIGGATSTSLRYWAAFPWFLRRDLKAVARLRTGEEVLVSSFFPMPWVASRLAAATGSRHASLCFEPFPFFHDADVISMYPQWKALSLRALNAGYGRIDVSGLRAADAIVTLNAATEAQIRETYGRSRQGRTRESTSTCSAPTRRRRPPTCAGASAVVRWWSIRPTSPRSSGRTWPCAPSRLPAARFPEARMVITSTRQDRSEERKVMDLAGSLGVGDKILAPGFLPLEDLARLYSAASVVLQTGTSLRSGATTMSLPVKEAMACGTAVVRSATTDEDVEDGLSGYLVDPSDVRATGQALVEVLTNPEQAVRMGHVGRSRISRTYDWSHVVSVIDSAIGP